MLIDFRKVDIKNFLSIDEISPIEFNDGITLLSGKNETDTFSESNGSGKSAIIDAIVWCITGSTTRGISSDAVINRYRTDVGCSVRVTVEINKTFYKITRTRGGSYGNTLKIVKDFKEDVSGNTVKKSQDILYNLIPLTSQDLTSLIILSQDMPNKLSSMSPSSRKSLLEGIADYDSDLESTKELFKKKQAEYDDEFEKLTREMHDLMNSKGVIIGEVKQIETKISEYEELERVQSSKKAEIDSQNEVIEKEVAIAYADLNRKKAEYCSVEAEKFLLEEQLHDIDTIYKRINSLDFSKSLHERDLSNYRNKLDSIIGKINNLKPNTCPTCSQQIEVLKYEELRSLYESEKLTLDKSVSEELKVIQEIKDELIPLRDRYDRELRENNEKKSVIRDIDFRLELIKKEMIECERRTMKHKIHFEEVDYKTLISKSLSDKSDKLSEISELEGEINKKSTLIIDIETNQGLNSTILGDISRGSFRTFLLNKVMDKFNELLAVVSIELMKDKPVILDFDGNKVEILYDNKVYEQLSSGERKRVDISIELTVRKYKSLVKGVSFNLLVMDETFDSLDRVGINSIFKAVEVSGTCSSFIVVSHRNDIFLDYDRKYVVVKRNSLTTLEGR